MHHAVWWWKWYSVTRSEDCSLVGTLLETKKSGRWTDWRCWRPRRTAGSSTPSSRRPSRPQWLCRAARRAQRRRKRATGWSRPGTGCTGERPRPGPAGHDTRRPPAGIWAPTRQRTSAETSANWRTGSHRRTSTSGSPEHHPAGDRRVVSESQHRTAPAAVAAAAIPAGQTAGRRPWMIFLSSRLRRLPSNTFSRPWRAAARRPSSVKVFGQCLRRWRRRFCARRDSGPSAPSWSCSDDSGTRSSPGHAIDTSC